MNWHVVWAVVVRHLYNFKHSWDRLSDVFYWPAMDIIIWGFTSTFIAQKEGSLSFVVTTLLSGVILWMVIWRGQYEITVNLLEEMWSHNMVNLFASPIRLREWIAGVLILGVIKMLCTVGFAIFIAYIVYKANIFTLGFYLIPFMISLLLTGWAIGLFVAAFIMRYGTKIQTLAWTGAALISPFSGVFYPISTLPSWAQNISTFLPTSYIFEGMRQVVSGKHLASDLLLKSYLLNILYIAIALAWFIFMFEKSKQKSLARLD